MKCSSRIRIVLVGALVLTVCAGSARTQAQRQAPQILRYAATGERFGFIPPPMDLGHIRVTHEYLMLLQPPPSSWDWRSLGGVTPVKNQNPYGCCWAFAALGDLESKVLIGDVQTRDYSEHNVTACAPNQFYDNIGYNCNTGGNAWLSTNYLSTAGSVMESCDPYPGSCPSIVCSNPSCLFQKQVTEWRIIPNNVTAIKNAVMTYGPVYSAMYAGFSGFSTYDGSYCLTYTGTDDPNHAVLIVGWDDSMCSENGAWIAKNSWGTGWGDAGYFYIQYGHAQMGAYANVITVYKHFDDREKIYSYDEFGWQTSYGWDTDDWGMVAITPDWSGVLYAVDFWATGSPTTYTIYVYDTFSGGSLSDLLAGPLSDTVQEAGYYSIELPDTVEVTKGDPVYLVVRYQTPTYPYAVPVDDHGPMETGKTFISNTGSTWIDEGAGGAGYGDIGIRGRVLPNCYNIPMLDIEMIGAEYVDLVTLKATRYWLEVVNRAEVPDVLFEISPDLPPCMGNPNSSRATVEIFDQDYNWLNGYCVLSASDDLDSLYFEVYDYMTRPDSVSIGLSDRRCYISYGSDFAVLPPCVQPVLTDSSYQEVSWNDPLWEIQVELCNLGPDEAYAVSATMGGGPAWLTISDPDCDYGTIPVGTCSMGNDSYTLDLTNYPGGTFSVTLDVTYDDVCVNSYSVQLGVDLDPEATDSDVPEARLFRLVQNYPNPFNPSTTIEYHIPIDCHVSLRVYDVSGRLVRVLVDRHKERGIHEVEWDGRDNGGRIAASGIYFYRIEAGGHTDTKRMVFIR